VQIEMLSYHNICRLSRGSVVRRFAKCLDEIRLLLANEKLSVQELNVVWLFRFIFSLFMFP
jgi:hypothetical protein